MKTVYFLILLMGLSFSASAESTANEISGVYVCEIAKECLSEITELDNGDLLWSPMNCAGDVAHFQKTRSGNSYRDGSITLSFVKKGSILRLTGGYAGHLGYCFKRSMK